MNNMRLRGNAVRKCNTNARAASIYDQSEPHIGNRDVTFKYEYKQLCFYFSGLILFELTAVCFENIYC